MICTKVVAHLLVMTYRAGGEKKANLECQTEDSISL